MKNNRHQASRKGKKRSVHDGKGNTNKNMIVEYLPEVKNSDEAHHPATVSYFLLFATIFPAPLKGQERISAAIKASLQGLVLYGAVYTSRLLLLLLSSVRIIL